MKSLLLSLCLVALAAVGLRAAADVAGTWNVDGEIAGNPVKFSCVLKQDGDKLTGTATLGGKEVPMTGGVTDKNVTFQLDVDHEGAIYTLVFTGTLEDAASIKGFISVSGAEGNFTAKRQ